MRCNLSFLEAKHMCKKDLLRDIDIQNAISKNYNTTVVYQMVSNILADEMLKIINEFSKNKRYIKRKDICYSTQTVMHKLGSEATNFGFLTLTKHYKTYNDIMKRVEINDSVPVTDNKFIKTLCDEITNRMNSHLKNGFFVLKYDKNKKYKFKFHELTITKLVGLESGYDITLYFGIYNIGD